MIRHIISFVRFFRKPIQWLGVDYQHFESLYWAKLTMDFRQKESRSAVFGQKKQNFLGQFLLFALFGLMIGLSFFTVDDIMLNLILCFTVIMVMTGSLLISEFTTVLFDVRDNQILLARPVSSRTLLFTRLMHIHFHLGSIALALSLCSAVVLAIKTNIGVMLVFFIGVGLCVWFTVFLTTFIYLALSKVVAGEKFKDLVSYIQILLGILIFGGYQFMPRIMDMEALQTATLAIHWWTYLVPPVWLAAFVKLSLFSGLTQPIYLLALMGIVIPLGGMFVIIRLLATGFGNLLSEGSESTIKTEKRIGLKGKSKALFYRLFCVSSLEAAGWKLAIATTRRDRKFKQAVYPSFGYILIFIVIMMKPDFGDLPGYFEKLAQTNRYLMLIFFSYFLTTATTQLPYTDTPEAGWIYQALPVKRKRHLLSGAVKAILFKFAAPFYLILTIAVTAIWGFDVLPKMILGFLLVILVTQLTLIIQKMGLPFTLPREMVGKGTNMLRSFLPLILFGLAAGLLHLTTKVPFWATYIACAAAIGAVILCWRQMRKPVRAGPMSISATASNMKR